MRLTLVLLICAMILLAESASSKRHRKKHKKDVVTTTEQPTDELDMIAEDNDQADQLAEVKEEENVIQDTKEAVKPKEEEIKVPPKEDPCAKVHCGPGKECAINKDGEGECQCMEKCPEEIDERRKVCTNHNETWEGDCQVYRMRCLCTTTGEGCKDPKYSHAHVDYYGSCRDIPACSEDEMSDFPRRMREWLFNVMKDLARRAELDPDFLRLEKEAEKSMSRKWVNAVIWKFCDLDSHPHDRSVSRHELFPIRAPLLAMEHCIAPFLDACDANDDHVISLVEWGKCLGLEENEIEDKCASFRSFRKE